MRGVISYSLTQAKHVVMRIKWKAFWETVKFGTKFVALADKHSAELQVMNIKCSWQTCKFCVVLEKGCSDCDWEH